MKLINTRPLAFLFALTLTAFHALAQDPFQRFYPDDAPSSYGAGLHEGQNGGYVLSRSLYSYSQTPAWRFVVERMDAAGAVLQTKGYTHPSGFGLFMKTSEATGDGGSISIGKILDANTFTDSVCVLRLDPTGSILWSKAMAFAAAQHEAKGVVELTDGSFVAYGVFQDPVTFRDKVFLSKMNASGAPVWSRIISSTDEDESYAIGGLLETTNGDLWISGQGGLSSLWMIRLDPNGVTILRNSLEIPEVFDFGGIPHGLFARPDGNMDYFYSPGLFFFDVGPELVVIRVSSTGNVLQYKAFDLSEFGYSPEVAIDQLDNGDYFIGISTDQLDQEGFVMSMRANTTVDRLKKTYIADQFVHVRDVLSIAGGGVMVYAEVQPQKEDGQGWLFRTDLENELCNIYSTDHTETSGTGTTSAFSVTETMGSANANTTFTMISTSAPRTPLCTNLAVVETEKERIALFPNPSNGTFTIDLGTNSSAAWIRIADMLGRVVHEQSIRDQGTINVGTSLPEGLYSVTILDRKNQILGTERSQVVHE